MTVSRVIEAVILGPGEWAVYVVWIKREPSRPRAIPVCPGDDCPRGIM